MNYNSWNYNKPFKLENGVVLNGLQVAYHTYGKLNKDKSNVIWVCHALTANSDVFEWWKGLFGAGCLFNPEEHFIICANNLGSCYGSTGPLSLNPDVNSPYYHLFPEVTIRDMVKAHDLLREHLGISSINTILGGSQGGQQVLEWNILHPGLFENCIVLATNAQHSPWGIAFNEAQRMAIRADRTYYSNSAEGGQKGMKAARAIALLSYRNYQTYQHTQQEEGSEKTNSYKASSYQNYQGEKLVKRFNAYSYMTLSAAMDSHHVGRGRASVTQALSAIQANTLAIGIRSDLLFPVNEQQFIADHVPSAVYEEIDSFYGHDGFLIETEKISMAIKNFKDKINNQPLTLTSH